MSETIDRLRNKFRKWLDVSESKSLKVYLQKTKVMLSGGIPKDGTSKNKDYPCWIWGLNVVANSALCIQYRKWIHRREIVDQEERLCNEVETARLYISWQQGDCR